MKKTFAPLKSLKSLPLEQLDTVRGGVKFPIDLTALGPDNVQ